MLGNKKLVCDEGSFDKYFTADPIVLIDVGFRDGIQKKWSIFEKYLRVIGFEPDKTEYENLVKKYPSYTIFDTALYKESKDNLELYITRSGLLCSILPPNRAFLDDFPETERFDVIKKALVKADTLDNVLGASNIGHVDFIKVDTQGSELYILEGANSLLQGPVFGLEIEVEFAPMYKDQPLFADVDNFVRSQGFQLFDLKKHFWRRKAGLGFDGSARGQLIHGDALYFREANHYIDLLRNTIADPGKRKSCVLKAISICQLFGYSDYALDLCQKAGDSGFFSDKESYIAEKYIKNVCSRFVVPNFKGKGIFVRMISALNNMFTVSYHGWALRDKPDVGNNI